MGGTMYNAALNAKGMMPIMALPTLATMYLPLISNSKAITNTKAAGFRLNNISAGGWSGKGADSAPSNSTMVSNSCLMLVTRHLVP